MSRFNHVALLKSRVQNNGGLEKYANRIANAFADMGSRVSILTTETIRSFPDHPNISFYPVATSSWPPFLRMEQFDRFAKAWGQKENPDIVFGMDRNRVQTHIRAGNGVHASYLKSRILTEGNLKHWICLLNPMHRKILELEKAAFENPNLKKIFANSRMVQAQILEHYKVDPHKIEVIHNGVEWHEMENAFQSKEASKQKFCKKFQIDPNAFHFLFIGNGYLRKGLGVLLSALSRLKMEDFHLSVVGKDNRQELFQAKAVQLGLKNKVRFFGAIEDITPFYQLSDALVIPSFYDPFANVTVEALAMGLFIISSKQNGGHEILTQENGIVIEDLMDVDSVVHALEASLTKRKTEKSAFKIRESVAHLDFSMQLKSLIRSCE